MKRFVSILLLLSLMVCGVVFAADQYYITLDAFIQKYQSAVQTINTLLMMPVGGADVQVGYTTDGSELLSFLIEEDLYTVRGNAFPDTGVISALQIFVKDTKGQQASLGDLKKLGIFFSISDFKDFMTAISDEKGFIAWSESLSNAMEKGKDWNGYKTEAVELGGVGGWLSSVGLTYKGDAPKPENVPDAKDSLYYIQKYVTSAAQTSGKSLSAGEYVVGQHIVAGEYSVSTTASGVNFFVYRGGSLRVNEIIKPDNEMGRVVLKEGDNIEISGGKLIFTPLQ